MVDETSLERPSRKCGIGASAWKNDMSCCVVAYVRRLRVERDGVSATICADKLGDSGKMGGCRRIVPEPFWEWVLEQVHAFWEITAVR